MGFGASVISKLVNTCIKRNLYYEIKDKVVEEVVNNGGSLNKKSVRTKVYGLDETKNTRELLMEILRQRMEYHKDKFISKDLYEELETLEVKRSGKIEHASNAHDDLVFSYLLALYIWYEGKDLMERWGIVKQSIRTDEEYDGTETLEQKVANIVDDIVRDQIDDEVDPSNLKAQLEYLASDKTMSYQDWARQELKKDEAALEALKRNKIAREAYMRTYHVHEDDMSDTTRYDISSSIFVNFNSFDDEYGENYQQNNHFMMK